MKLEESNHNAVAKLGSLDPLERELLIRLAERQVELDKAGKDGKSGHPRKKFKAGQIDLGQLVSDLKTTQSELEKAVQGLQVKNLILMPSFGRFEFTLPFTELNTTESK